MSPRIRVLLFAAVGAALGIYIGVDLADESYGLAVLVALVALWIIAERASKSPPEAWLMGVLIVGYIVGNRGFAQIQPSPSIPLLPAEAVLLVAVPLLIARSAIKQANAFRKDFLNIAILIWVIFGAIRLPIDIGRFGVLALRDFAMAYYAVYFFIAQALGDNVTSTRVLTRSFTVAFALLIPTVISIQISPDFLYDHFTWSGVPIIYHKSDLIATSLAAGFFWLWTRGNASGNRIWFVLSATSLLLIGLMASPRAAMTAIAVTTVVWLLAGRWKIAVAQVGIVSVAAILGIAALSFTGKDLKTSIPYSMYEHAISIFDPAGTGTYINGESGDPGSNNQFRLVWWRDVIGQTLSTNPAFGLGYGADLSTQFLIDYDLISDETFAARSPHSMIVTVFGRTGVVGLAAWLVVIAAISQAIWRLIKSGEPDGSGLASVVCVVGTSACFGVVLEGPMGAVLFWTALGLANSRLKQSSTSGETRPVTEASPQAPDDWQVAKAGTFDT
jgi:hypothetical protein